MKGMLHGKNEILPNPFSPEFVNTRLQEGNPANQPGSRDCLQLKEPPMRKISFIVCSLTLLVTACQKENSQPDPQRASEDTVVRLIKTVTYQGVSDQDSVVETFTYDASGRVSEKQYHAIVHDNGAVVVHEGFVQFLRDVVGRVTSYTHTIVSDNPGAVSPVTEIVTYKSPSSFEVQSLNEGARTYEYNDEGKVSRTTEYQHLPNPTDPLVAVVYHQYSYDDNGNLTRREEFTDLDGDGGFILNVTYRLEYDSHPNPMYSGDDAYLEFWWATAQSKNNVVKFNFDAVGNSSSNTEIGTSFQYRADGLPTSCTYSGDNYSNRTVFYYNK